METSTEVKPKTKGRLTTLLLAFFLGVLGVHRFYTGHIKSGVVQLLTFGGFGIWLMIDLIFLLTGMFKDKQGNVLEWEFDCSDHFLLRLWQSCYRNKKFVTGLTVVIIGLTIFFISDITMLAEQQTRSQNMIMNSITGTKVYDTTPTESFFTSPFFRTVGAVALIGGAVIELIGFRECVLNMKIKS